MIVYTCPRCGHDLVNGEIAVIPPVKVKQCYYCGFYSEEKEEVVRIPYGVPDVSFGGENISNSPCIYCPNSPRNGGSGVCSCVLGDIILH